MKILFISGAQRSGTTMLEQALNTHPEFFITHELDWIHMLNNVNRAIYHPRHTSRKVLHFNGNYVPLIEMLYGGSTTKEISVIGDKLPSYVYSFDILYNFFPDAKHLFCLRNPLDVINSMITRAYDRKIGLDRGWDVDLNLETMCSKFNDAYGNFLRFSKTNLDKVRIVKYEEITQKPLQEMDLISKFIGCSNSFDVQSIKAGKKSREHLTEEMTTFIKSRIHEGLREYENE